MSKRREPLGLRRRVLKVEETEQQTTENQEPKAKEPATKANPKVEIAKENDPKLEPNLIEQPAKVVAKSKPTKTTPKPKGKGRPSTKKGKKLVKYSMDIHPELKRAVVKAAAIYDKEVHVMWNEIIFDWLEKETKKHPDWYASIKIKKTEL